MRSDFTITKPPRIVLGSPAYSGTGFTFSWTAPTNVSFQVDYSSALPPAWSSFTNIVTSSNGTFIFTDTGLQSGGLGGLKVYRVRTGP